MASLVSCRRLSRHGYTRWIADNVESIGNFLFAVIICYCICNVLFVASTDFGRYLSRWW